METWNIILLGSDLILMGAVLYLLLRLKNTYGDTPQARQSASRSRDDAVHVELEAELHKMRCIVEDLEKRRAEMETYNAELERKQQRLSDVIAKVDEVLEALSSPDPLKNREEEIARAKELLRTGEPLEKVSEKLKLYKGEVELLSSLERLASD